MSDIPGKRYRSHCWPVQAVSVSVTMYVATSVQLAEIDRLAWSAPPSLTRPQFGRLGEDVGARGMAATPVRCSVSAAGILVDHLWTSSDTRPDARPVTSTFALYRQGLRSRVRRLEPCWGTLYEVPRDPVTSENAVSGVFAYGTFRPEQRYAGGRGRGLDGILKRDR